MQHPDGAATPVIDASVHIFFKSTKDLRGVLREPFKSRGFPDYEMAWYGAARREYATGTKGPDRKYPSSDPDFVGHPLFAAPGVASGTRPPTTPGSMPH